MHRFSKTVCGLMAIALGTTTACGDSDGPTATATLSPAEARVVASTLFGEISAAIGSPGASSATMPATASIASVPTLTASINANCSGGGTLKGTYLFTDGLNSAGTGTKSGSITVAASQCTVSTGERTISADGSYLYTFSVDFTDHVQSSNFVWQAGGTLNWTGGSCTLDYTVEVAPNGARSFSGTVCGVDISGSGS